MVLVLLPRYGTARRMLGSFLSLFQMTEMTDDLTS